MPITDADAREADPTSMDTQTKVTCKREEGLEAGVRRSGIAGWGSQERIYNLLRSFILHSASVPQRPFEGLTKTL